MSPSSLLCRLLGHPWQPWHLERAESSWTLVSSCARCLAVRSCSFPEASSYESAVQQALERWGPSAAIVVLKAWLLGIAETVPTARGAIHPVFTPPPDRAYELVRGEAGPYWYQPMDGRYGSSSSTGAPVLSEPSTSTAMRSSGSRLSHGES